MPQRLNDTLVTSSANNFRYIKTIQVFKCQGPPVGNFWQLVVLIIMGGKRPRSKMPFQYYHVIQRNHKI